MSFAPSPDVENYPMFLLIFLTFRWGLRLGDSKQSKEGTSRPALPSLITQSVAFGVAPFKARTSRFDPTKPAASQQMLSRPGPFPAGTKPLSEGGPAVHSDRR